MLTLKEYKEEILEKFRRDCPESVQGLLSSNTPGSIAEACKYLWDTDIKPADKEALYILFKLERGISKGAALNQMQASYCKPIQALLTPDSKTIPNTSIPLDVLAWLVDFEPRPFGKYRKKNQGQPRNLDLKNPSKSDFSFGGKAKPTLSADTEKRTGGRALQTFALCAIIAILGVLVYYVSGIDKNVNTITNQCLYWEVDRYRPIDCDEVLPQAIAKTKIPFNETLFNDFRKVPNAEVATFATVLWKGTSPSGEIDYFAADGVHPVTRKKLVRVELETNKSELEKGKKGKEEIAEPVELKKTVKTIGILIFDNQNLDRGAIGQLERTRFKTFGSLGKVMASSQITESEREQLLAGNFSSISEKKRRELDYVCVGTIKYSYKKGKLSAETITCRISVDYDVLSTSTGIKQNELSRSISVSGIGFSEEEAKANALKKI